MPTRARTRGPEGEVRDQGGPPNITIQKMSDLCPPQAPEVVKAALHNLDEMIVLSLNHSRVFKNNRYYDPKVDSAIKAQEQALRILRILGPEVKEGQLDETPTPAQLAEARKVLKKFGWQEPEEQNDGDDD